MMINIIELTEKEIRDHTHLFADTVSSAMADLCGANFLRNNQIESCHRASEAVIGITIFTYFTGTVQGNYSINLPHEVARDLLEADINERGELTIDEVAVGLFEEALNIAVGTLIEELKEKYGFLTFNPPVISVGAILFPNYRNCTSYIEGKIGSIRCIFSINMANLEITDKLLKTMKDLKSSTEDANIDPLTQIYNRKYYNFYIAKFFGQKRLLSFVIFDVDKFKEINDGYGHGVGDLALSYIAQVLKKNGRETDYPIRFGGAEFIIILEESPLIGAFRLMERVAKDLIEEPLELEDGQKLQITVSAGIAEHQKGETIEQLFERADRALYRAKEGGRNQICGHVA